MRAIIIFFLLLTATMATAQSNTSNIRGVVTDAQSQFPLPGVTVLVVGTDSIIGASTDMDGQFVLRNVPVGRNALQFSFIGYETRFVSNMLVFSGKDLEVNMALTESVMNLDAAEIVAEDKSNQPKNDMTTVSARSFSVEEAMRYSGSLQDPSRMAQNFAGVSNASDDRNDIIIRGNSPSGVLWRMEGVDIPSPNHFSTLGTTG